MYLSVNYPPIIYEYIYHVCHVSIYHLSSSPSYYLLYIYISINHLSIHPSTYISIYLYHLSHVSYLSSIVNLSIVCIIYHIFMYVSIIYPSIHTPIYLIYHLCLIFHIIYLFSSYLSIYLPIKLYLFKIYGGGSQLRVMGGHWKYPEPFFDWQPWRGGSYWHLVDKAYRCH